MSTALLVNLKAWHIAEEVNENVKWEPEYGTCPEIGEEAVIRARHGDWPLFGQLSLAEQVALL